MVASPQQEHLGSQERAGISSSLWTEETMAVADYLQSPARGMCPHMPCLQRGGHQRHHHQYWVSTPLCSAALPGYVICGLVLVVFFFFPTTYIIPNKNNLEIIVCKTKLLKSDQVTQCMLASQTHQQYCPQQT